MENTITKTYWYCSDHNDAYYMIDDEVDKPNRYNTFVFCCTKQKKCNLEYIGYRIYGQHYTVYKDSVPDESWFTRRNKNGMEKSDLEFVRQITLQSANTKQFNYNQY